MANNIDIRSLNAMFNDYLKNGGPDQEFAEYCMDKGYFVGNVNNDSYNFDFSRFRKAKYIDTSMLTTYPEKYRSYIAFLSYIGENGNNNRITNERAISRTLMDLLEDMPLNTGLGLQKKEAENLYNKYLKNSNHKMKKMHPKTAFVAKKIGIPIIATIAVCALIGATIAASGLVAGALPFLTDSLLLNIGSLATLGALAGAIIAPTVIAVKNAIVKSYYARKYGIKTNNLNRVLNTDIAKIRNAADIENLILPINELFKKFKKTEEKIKNSKHSINPFKHIANYFREKTNRNRLHAIMDVLKNTNSEYNRTKNDKIKMFRDYIVDQTKNLELSRKYADIIARSRVNKKERNKISNLKAAHGGEYKELSVDIFCKDPYTPADRSENKSKIQHSQHSQHSQIPEDQRRLGNTAQELASQLTQQPSDYAQHWAQQVIERNRREIEQANKKPVNLKNLPPETTIEDLYRGQGIELPENNPADESRYITIREINNRPIRSPQQPQNNFNSNPTGSNQQITPVQTPTKEKPQAEAPVKSKITRINVRGSLKDTLTEQSKQIKAAEEARMRAEEEARRLQKEKEEREAKPTSALQRTPTIHVRGPLKKALIDRSNRIKEAEEARMRAEEEARKLQEEKDAQEARRKSAQKRAQETRRKNKEEKEKARQEAERKLAEDLARIQGDAQQKRSGQYSREDVDGILNGEGNPTTKTSGKNGDYVVVHHGDGTSATYTRDN